MSRQRGMNGWTTGVLALFLMLGTVNLQGAHAEDAASQDVEKPATVEAAAEANTPEPKDKQKKIVAEERGTESTDKDAAPEAPKDADAAGKVDTNAPAQGAPVSPETDPAEGVPTGAEQDPVSPNMEKPVDVPSEAEAIPQAAGDQTPAAAGEGIAHPWQLNFQEPATPVMERLVGLTNGLHVTMTVVTVFVMILLLVVIVKFRETKNPVASRTTHHTLLEILWTTIPILILVAILVPSIKLHYYMEKAEDPDMTLKVVGYQWYWHYDYPEEGFGFDSYIVKEEDLKPGQPRLLTTDNPVVIPVNTTVRVQVTGGDVIHSFAMPAFGIKQDAVPGRLNETWFRAEKTGLYHGQCSEICGVNHGFMPIEIRVVTQEEYKAWVAKAKEQFAATGAHPQFAALAVQE